MSGVKGENTVKVIGPDLHVNEAKAQEIVDVMETVRGVEDLGMFHSLGQPNLRITPRSHPVRPLRPQHRRRRAGRPSGHRRAGGHPGLRRREAASTLTVRWAPPFRKDQQTIRNILVATPDGNQVPLGQLAEIVEEEGPSLVYREDLRRYTPVKFSVRGRDLASTIAEARAEDRGEGEAALRHAPRVGGRDQPAQRDHAPAPRSSSR